MGRVLAISNGIRRVVTECEKMAWEHKHFYTLQLLRVCARPYIPNIRSSDYACEILVSRRKNNPDESQ
jgi:hypothetical protein